MRRIPRRPSRAVDPSASIPLSARPRCTHLRTPTAAFSTTPPAAFLVPADKQDKKTHQRMVRRWQKRIFGESEPIGAHVDPYDPTSPVRIAPEEQGDYEELLAEESDRGDEIGDAQFYYLPAEELDSERPGDKLMHIGGAKWLEQRREGAMAKEFEKLTLRTYTPLSLDMANEIEELTGTPYTLRDKNLMMAQEVHEVTGRPYTKYNFGLYKSGDSEQFHTPDQLRVKFVQAVAEVYTLKAAGMKLDLAKLPNKGVYRRPDWVSDIRLYKTNRGKFALVYPKGQSASELLQAMQSVPEWESTQAIEEEEVLVDEAEDLLDPVLPQEPVPTMDPATPAFKRGAVVKIDPYKKPFDFMSNRPSPRAKPAPAEKIEEVVEAEEPAPAEKIEIVEAEEPAVQPPVPPTSRLAELSSAFQTSTSAVNDLRHTTLEIRAQKLADEIAALRKAAQSSMSSSSPAARLEGVKWRHVPLTDIKVKFALFKRLYQLTGIRISDPHLNDSKTLGHLFGYLCAAVKPQTSNLFEGIHMEAQGMGQASPRRRADLASLLKLGHVEVRRAKVSEEEKLTKTGMQKVIDYALYERGLHPSQDKLESAPERDTAPHPLGLEKSLEKRRNKYFEGTRDVPEYGRPVASGAVNVLIRATRKAADAAAAKA